MCDKPANLYPSCIFRVPGISNSSERVQGQSFRLVEACNQYVGPFASNMQVQGSMNNRWLVTSAHLERLLQLDIGLPHGVCQQHMHVA